MVPGGLGLRTRSAFEGCRAGSWSGRYRAVRKSVSNRREKALILSCAGRNCGLPTDRKTFGVSKTTFPITRLHLPALCLLAGLSACSFADETLWPVAAGETPGSTAASAKPAAAQAGTASTASTLDGNAAAGKGTAPEGGKAAQLRSDLDRLNGDIAEHRRDLDALKAELDESAKTVDGLTKGIETRLKSGTVPNDPQVATDWNKAEAQLDRMSRDIGKLTAISNGAVDDSVLASYVLQSARTAAGQPQTSAAERKSYAALEDEARSAADANDRILTGVSAEIASRNLFLSRQHRRLAMLVPGLAAEARQHARSGSGEATEAAATEPAGFVAPERKRRPLVTIRFDRPDVAFAQPLYEAVNAALKKRPNAVFDIVAVSPPGAAGGAYAASTSEQNVEQVVQSLTGMGLPPARLHLSAETREDVGVDEVRIYVR
jgi:hypothetical protein